MRHDPNAADGDVISRGIPNLHRLSCVISVWPTKPEDVRPEGSSSPRAEGASVEHGHGAVPPHLVCAPQPVPLDNRGAVVERGAEDVEDLLGLPRAHAEGAVREVSKLNCWLGAQWLVHWMIGLRRRARTR